MSHSRLWEEYLRLHAEIQEVRRGLLGLGDCLLSSVRSSLQDPAQRVAALQFIQHMGRGQRESLVEDVLNCGLFVHGATELSWDILAQSKEVSIRSVKLQEVEILRSKDYEAFACLLKIWDRLGCDVHAKELASEYAHDQDEDLRDVAQSFLEDANRANL
jgi:hypothetical protein